MLNKMKALVARERQHMIDFARAAHKFEHKMVARATLAGHSVYYALVAWEAHASYRFAAGALLVMLALEAIPAPKD